MERLRNYNPLLIFFTIIHIITVNADYECQDVASQYIKFKEDHQYHFEDCTFVDLQFGEHMVARNIKINILSIAGKVLETLDLYETNGLLADFSTPVYLSQVDSVKSVRRLVKVDNYTFNKTTINQYARDLGYFTFYQDRSKMASMIYFFRDSLDISLEGNVGNYVLRRLPSNFHNGYYQYIYVQVLENNGATDVWNDFDVFPEPSFNLGASGVEAIDAGLFIALDLQHNFDKTPSELMKILLMYFNFIDMINGNFTSPRIHIKTKGIIIPQLEKPNPYLGSTSPFSSKLHFQQTSELMGFIYTHKDYFDVNNHDIVILLTERMMYGSSEVPPKLVKMETLNKHKICDVNEDPSIFLSYHVDYQAAHNILLSQLYYLFSSNNDEINKRNGCSKYWNNIQGKRSKLYRTLSSCIIDSYSDYFRNANCSYFSKNKK